MREDGTSGAAIHPIEQLSAAMTPAFSAGMPAPGGLEIEAILIPVPLILMTRNPRPESRTGC